MTSPNLEPTAQESQAPLMEIVKNPEAQAGPKVEQFISAEDALKVLRGEHDKVANEIAQGPLSQVQEAAPVTQQSVKKLEVATQDSEQKISSVAREAQVAEEAREKRKAELATMAEGGYKPIATEDAMDAAMASGMAELDAKRAAELKQERIKQGPLVKAEITSPGNEAEIRAIAEAADREEAEAKATALARVVPRPGEAVSAEAAAQRRQWREKFGMVEKPAVTTETATAKEAAPPMMEAPVTAEPQAAEAAPATEQSTMLVGGTTSTERPVVQTSPESGTLIGGAAPTERSVDLPPVAAERHSLRQAFSVAPAESAPTSATLVSGVVAEKTFGVSPMAESVRVAESPSEAPTTIAEAAPVPPAETPLEAANTIPEAAETMRSAGVSEKAPVSAEPITLAATPEAKSVSMEAAATIKEAAPPVMVENAVVESATIKEPEALKVEAVPATKGGTMRMEQQPAVGDEDAVTARMAEVVPATKGGTLRMVEVAPATKGGTLRMAEIKTHEAAMAVAGAAAATEISSTEAPIELAVTPEQLAAEKAQVSLENKFDVIDKLKSDEWNEAYTGYGVDWKKEQWDALSSDKKPGAFASEKEMFKQLRMNAAGNQFKFDQLNADLKGLGEKIRAAEAAGGATELQQLKQQESDLLLQLRKVEELKNQNETAERALQALVVERIAKSKAESSGISVEDAIEAAAVAAAAKANQAQNQPAAQSAANVNIPTAVPKKGMGTMAMTGAGIAGLAVGVGFWAAKGIGGFLKGIGWIVDSFAKSKTFGDALTHMWDKATKKLDEAYNKKREDALK